MKLSDGTSDAIHILRRIHREMKQLQDSIGELEYLIYKIDERCKIEIFPNQNMEVELEELIAKNGLEKCQEDMGKIREGVKRRNDERRSQERVTTD